MEKPTKKAKKPTATSHKVSKEQNGGAARVNSGEAQGTETETLATQTPQPPKQSPERPVATVLGFFALHLPTDFHPSTFMEGVPQEETSQREREECGCTTAESTTVEPIDLDSLDSQQAFHLGTAGTPIEPSQLDAVLQGMGYRSWDDVWSSFCAKHTSWWDRNGQNGPVYAIPLAVIDELAADSGGQKGRRARNALIETEDAEAEREFALLCESWSGETVGVQDGELIQYELLRELDAAAISRLLTTNPTSTAKWVSRGAITRAGLETDPARLAASVNADRRQQLGFVGRLTFEKQYREELQTLQALKKGLSLSSYGSGALLGPANVQGSPAENMQSASSSEQQFLSELTKFLQKWQLARLVTSDLPLPQVPLHGIPAGLVAQIRGTTVTVDYTPPYYDIPSGVDVRERLRTRQAAEGRALGIHELRCPVTNSSGRGKNVSELETAFRMWLIELSVTRRYEKPRGYVERLLTAYSTTFGKTTESLRKLREERVKPALPT